MKREVKNRREPFQLNIKKKRHIKFFIKRQKLWKTHSNKN